MRKRFIKILTSNIRNVLLRETENAGVIHNWDFIEVRAKVQRRPQWCGYSNARQGIHHILESGRIPV